MKLEPREGQKVVKAKCHADYCYEETLTSGKVYEVVAEEGIFATDPYYRFIGDNGKECHAHQARFTIIEEENP